MPMQSVPAARSACQQYVDEMRAKAAEQPDQIDLLCADAERKAMWLGEDNSVRLCDELRDIARKSKQQRM